MQRLRELFVQQVGLVDAVLQAAFHGGGLEIRLRNVTVIQFERDRFTSSYATRFNGAVGLYGGWRP